MDATATAWAAALHAHLEAEHVGLLRRAAEAESGRQRDWLRAMALGVEDSAAALVEQTNGALGRVWAVRNGICLHCGAAVLDREHLRVDLEPCASDVT